MTSHQRLSGRAGALPRAEFWRRRAERRREGRARRALRRYGSGQEAVALLARSDRTVVVACPGNRVAKVWLVRGREELVRFHREISINRMLSGAVSELVVPPMYGWNYLRRSLMFGRLEGAVVAAKYPTGMSPEDGLLLLRAEELVRATQIRSVLPALPVASRLRHYRWNRVLPERYAATVDQAWRASDQRMAFAHGDFTPRNVVRLDRGGCAVIDWEYGGAYPVGYDLAFLWYCLGNCPDGRAVVEAHPLAQQLTFWVSAVLIHARHLLMWAGRLSERVRGFFPRSYRIALERACAY